MAASNFDVSLGSAVFFPFDFFAIVAGAIVDCGVPEDAEDSGGSECPFTRRGWELRGADVFEFELMDAG